MLDLCCGTGRHLRELGCLGVDLNRQGLRGLPAACADMRALPLRTGSLDAVVSLFSSFGYLESDEQDLLVLREVARVLRPGGKLLLDLLNREHALAGFVESVQEVREDGGLVVEQRSFDLSSGRLTTSFVMVGADGSRRDSIGHSLRLYTLTELRKMLDAAGLTLLRVYGGVAGGAGFAGDGRSANARSIGEDYALDSVRMMAVISR